MQQYPDAAKVPGILVVRVDSVIYFSNSNSVKERLSNDAASILGTTMEFAIHLHSYKLGIGESLQCLFTIIAAKNLSEIIEVEEETPLAVATTILATPDHSKQAKAESSSPQKGHSTIDMEQDGLEDSQNKTKDHPRPPTADKNRKKRKD